MDTTLQEEEMADLQAELAKLRQKIRSKRQQRNELNPDSASFDHDDAKLAKDIDKLKINAKIVEIDAKILDIEAQKKALKPDDPLFRMLANDISKLKIDAKILDIEAQQKALKPDDPLFRMLANDISKLKIEASKLQIDAKILDIEAQKKALKPDDPLFRMLANDISKLQIEASKLQIEASKLKIDAKILDIEAQMSAKETEKLKIKATIAASQDESTVGSLNKELERLDTFITNYQGMLATLIAQAAMPPPALSAQENSGGRRKRGLDEAEEPSPKNQRVQALRPTKLDSVAFSSISGGQWNNFVQSARRHAVIVDLKPVIELQCAVVEGTPSGFTWDMSRTESAQINDCMAWMKANLPLGRENQFFDTSSQRIEFHLDNTKYSGSPGDVGITTELSVRAKRSLIDVRVIFELKKEVNNAHIRQAAMQLICLCLSMGSTQNQRVAVLTNLSDYWQFLFCDSNSLIHSVFVDNVNGAQAVVRWLTTNDHGDENPFLQQVRAAFSDWKIPLNITDLLTDPSDPVSDELDNNLFDVLSEDEKREMILLRALDRFERTPWFTSSDEPKWSAMYN